ncbi:hypothetical protein HPB51_008701 [Rhipicephalus microplus]|uniref:Uncharacterized protein n=1 Tax=Rhipicephalus microplus TaxID=6941 RepID=A0A9J6EZT6_RHIMP|nr:hypothetical protein HPB51_008701 [Rhipicephalus microplus]
MTSPDSGGSVDYDRTDAISNGEVRVDTDLPESGRYVDSGRVRVDADVIGASDSRFLPGCVSCRIKKVAMSMQGEWETRGKKKKPAKEGSQQQQQQQQQQKGDQGGPASSNKENRGGPRGEGGPPRNMPRGSGGGGRGGGRGGSWKNKEIEKNERNLEDGRTGERTGERTGDMRPRGGSRRGGRGGRGGGIGGGRGSRTFQNRGLGGHDGFPQSMDTWTNSTSTGGQRPSRGSQQQQQQQDTMAVAQSCAVRFELSSAAFQRERRLAVEEWGESALFECLLGPDTPTACD